METDIKDACRKAAAVLSAIMKIMTNKNHEATIRLLLIEDDPADAFLIKQILSNISGMTLEPVFSNRLSDALHYLEGDTIDIIITDLGLLDSQGMNTLVSILKKAPDIPVIVVTGVDDEDLAIEAVRAGAQDYLVKGHIDGNLLTRSIRYSMERHRLLQELKAISITDELTRLYNRRGFMVLAEKQFELASRINKLLWLFYLDIDNMKWINDNFGHEAGDNALTDTAKILKETFRKMDTIARVGGDEFSVIALEESNEEVQLVISRLKNNIMHFNAEGRRPYKLSVSIGAVPCEPKPQCDINALLSEADKFMYEQKTSKKSI
jgi:two-component system cell cycle response regulator